MMKNDYFYVLCIDSDKFILISCVYSENLINVISFDSIVSSGISDGNIVSIRETSSRINELISMVEQKVSMNIDNLYVFINNDNVFLKRHTGNIDINKVREITENDKKNLINKLYEKISKDDNKIKVIEVIPIYYKIDNKNCILDPVEMEGKILEIEADVVSVSKSMLDNIYKSINKSQISISGISYIDVVIKDICIFREEKEMGVLVLNFAIDYTNIIIVKNNNIIFSTRLCFGGNFLIKDVMYCLKVSFETAKEIIEKNLNIDIDDDNFVEYFDINGDKKYIIFTDLYNILEARLEEILLNIKDKILPGNYTLFPYGIVLMGWVSGIKFVKNFIEKIFESKVRLACISSVFKINEDVLPKGELMSNLIFLASLEYFVSKKDNTKKFIKKKSSKIFSNIKGQLERIL